MQISTEVPLLYRRMVSSATDVFNYSIKTLASGTAMCSEDAAARGLSGTPRTRLSNNSIVIDY